MLTTMDLVMPKAITTITNEYYNETFNTKEK